MNIINHIFSRRKIYISALIWGVFAIFLSGSINAPSSEAFMKFTGNVSRDTIYHYHVSSVLTTAITLLSFAILGVWGMQNVKHEGLTTALKVLILFDLIAIAAGAGLTFGMGWIKEILDALGGKFYDVKDIDADFIGVTHQVFWEAIFLLPAHGIYCLLADSFRRGIVHAFAPENIRNEVEKTFKIEENLNLNAQKMSANQNSLDLLERQLTKLKNTYNMMSDKDKKSARGSEIKGKIAGKETQLISMFNKIADLEEENNRLKAELIKINSTLKDNAENHAILEEITSVLNTCSRNAGRISELKERSAAKIMIADHIHDSEKEKVISNLTAPASYSETTPQRIEEHNETKFVSKELNDARLRILKLENDMNKKDSKLKELSVETEKLFKNSTILQAKLENVTKEKVDPLKKTVDALKRKVFIVEDDKEVRKVIGIALEETGLLETSSHENAIEAINFLKESKMVPDLVVLDIMMPLLNGIDFCKAMQKHKRLKNVPVVFCSACVEESMPNLEMVEYAAYVTKPLKIKQLEEAVLNALNIKKPF